MVFLPLAVTAASWLLQDRGARNFVKLHFHQTICAVTPLPTLLIQCAEETQRKSTNCRRQETISNWFYSQPHVLKPHLFFILSELQYKSAFWYFITLFFRAHYLFWSKVVYNCSLSLKAILQIYSAPVDMHQKSASSLNESQIGVFVTQKINESNEWCLTFSFLTRNWRAPMLFDAWPKHLTNFKY